MIGVNFQPGADQDQQQQNGGAPKSQGVQEAIKVLSLRLPKVVGAQAVAPHALLGAQGGMGRPGIDSIVESVLAKFFPQAAQGQGPQMPAPMVPPGSAQGYPQGAGNAQPQGYQQAQRQAPAQQTAPNFWSQTPRIIFDQPSNIPRPPEAPLTGGPRPGVPGVDGGGGFAPATIAPLPPRSLMDQLSWLYPSSPEPPQEEPRI